MSDYNLSSVELVRLHRMLREIAELAHHASITGFLKQGKHSAMQRYNAILQHFEQRGLVPPGLFRPLPNDASFDELNVEATLLASYIEDDVKQAKKGRGSSQNVGVSLEHEEIAEVLEEVQHLREMKEAVQEHMPELLETRAEARTELLAELQELRDLRASISELLPQLVSGQRAEAEPETRAKDRAELEQRLAEMERRLAEATAQRQER